MMAGGTGFNFSSIKRKELPLTINQCAGPGYRILGVADRSISNFVGLPARIKGATLAFLGK